MNSLIPSICKSGAPLSVIGNVPIGQGSKDNFCNPSTVSQSCEISDELAVRLSVLIGASSVLTSLDASTEQIIFE